jgi:5-methylcytosine-specific restriction endonuclease McrA
VLADRQLDGAVWDNSRVKTCTGCAATKPLTEFHRCGRSPDGYKPRCKDCRCQASRALYAQNAESGRAASQRWRKANPDLVRTYRRRWVEQNPDTQRAAEQRWAQANPERRAATINAWRAIHPERTRNYGYRHRIAESTETPETTARIAELLTQPCSYCEATENITIDHIVPLSRGGRHEPENLAAACRSCNCSKGAKPLASWLTGA